MRTLAFVVAAMLVASDGFAAPPKRRAKSNGTSTAALEEKIAGHATSMGTIPVENHEMYGPYKLWAWVERNKAINFEAKFVGIRNGVVVVGIDGKSTAATKTKQMNIYGFPLKKLPYPQQQALREEVAKRAKSGLGDAKSSKSEPATSVQPPKADKSGAKKD